MNILEIGIEKGGSLGLWRDYFYNSSIFGLDYRKKDCDNRDIKNFADDRVSISIFDSTNSEKIEKEYKNKFFNIIVDDGSHLVKNQIQTFENLYSKLAPGGIYIIEDVEGPDESHQIFKYITQKNFNAEIVNLSSIVGRGDDILIIGMKDLDSEDNPDIIKLFKEIVHLSKTMASGVDMNAMLSPEVVARIYINEFGILRRLQTLLRISETMLNTEKGKKWKNQ